MDIIEAVERSKIILKDSNQVFQDSKFDIIQLAEQKGFFKVSLKPNGLELNIGPYVGHVPINSKLSLNIRPKTKITNFFYLLKCAEVEFKFLEDFYSEYSNSNYKFNILDLLTVKLIKGLQEIERNGIYKTYRRLKENSSNLKGKLNLKDQFVSNTSKNIHHKVVHEYDEFSRNNIENKYIKYAIHILIRYYEKNLEKNIYLKKLKIFEELFINVDLDIKVLNINKSEREYIIRKLPNIRTYYLDALKISFLILDKASFKYEKNDDSNILPSIYVNTADVFEKFCRIGLSNRADKNSGETFNKSSVKLFSESTNKQKVEPDIVYSVLGNVKCLIDAKYKEKNPSREDIFQMITYLDRYNCDTGIFVMPLKENDVLETLGKVNNKKIYIYRVDITHEPELCENSLNDFYNFIKKIN